MSLQEEGYKVHWEIVCADAHGAPESRRRLYFVAVLDTAVSMEWAPFRKQCASVFASLRVPCRPLDAYLLDDKCPQQAALIHSWLQAFTRQEASRKKWQELHASMYQDNGFIWPYPKARSPLQHVSKDVLGTLTEREQDVLQLVLLTSKTKLVPAVDLSQSAGRTPIAQPGRVSCLLPVSDIMFSVLSHGSLTR